MVQTRTVEYGAAIQATDMPFDMSSIMAAGRLRGMEMTAYAVDQIAISPGTILMPNGVTVNEDEVKYVQVSNTAFAVSYTLAYQLEDVDVIGGTAASLNLISGIVKQENLTDSTVIGWVLYPGGAVALADSHLVLADTIRVEPRTAQLDVLHLAPFTDALRPPEERPGTPIVRSAAFTNMNVSVSSTQGIGGTTGRVTSATLVPGGSLAANGTSYDTFFLKRNFWVTGTVTLNSPSITNVSDPSRIAAGQGVSGYGIAANTTVVSVSGTTVNLSVLATATQAGTTLTFSDTLYSLSTAAQSLTSGVSKALVKNTLPVERFVLGASDTVSVGSVPSTVPPGGVLPGEISYVVSVPSGQTGNWTEGVVPIGGETANRWQNVSSSNLTYIWRLPFVVTGAGKLNKCVARLNVEASTVVTIKVLIGGSYITLSPASGTIANTGGLKTVELLIPSAQGITWEVGKVAYVEVAIQAQPGGAASFAYIGCTTENYPYTLFIGDVT